MSSQKQSTSQKVTYITPKGLVKLEDELVNLRTVRRREISQHLQDTMGEAEESEYQIALEEQAFIEGRIQELESILANYQVIEPGQSNGLIRVGSTVMIRENGMDAETYTIVGAAEANPETGLISNESPLGNALLGSSVGDDIEVNAPAGLLKFRVLAVQ
jgi:transcription elongation factor GreA